MVESGMLNPLICNVSFCLLDLGIEVFLSFYSFINNYSCILSTAHLLIHLNNTVLFQIDKKFTDDCFNSKIPMLPFYYCGFSR